MRIRFIMIIILVLMISIGCSEKKTEISSEEGSSEWVEYWRHDDGTVFLYNVVGIKKDTKEDIVQVWEIEVYSDEGREKYIQRMWNIGMSNIEWDKLSNTVILYEIDCKNRRSNILSITDYDMDGKVLYTGSYNETDWNDIMIDTTQDTLRKNVCK